MMMLRKSIKFRLGGDPKHILYFFYRNNCWQAKEINIKRIKTWNFEDGKFICKIEIGKLLGYNEKV